MTSLHLLLLRLRPFSGSDGLLGPSPICVSRITQCSFLLKLLQSLKHISVAFLQAILCVVPLPGRVDKYHPYPGTPEACSQGVQQMEWREGKRPPVRVSPLNLE